MSICVRVKSISVKRFNCIHTFNNIKKTKQISHIRINYSLTKSKYTIHSDFATNAKHNKQPQLYSLDAFLYASILLLCEQRIWAKGKECDGGHRNLE